MPAVGIFVKSFAHVAERMFLARTVVTRHPMGRPLGAPFDHDRHRLVTRAALELLEQAEGPGAVTEIDEAYRPGRSPQ